MIAEGEVVKILTFIFLNDDMQYIDHTMAKTYHSNLPGWESCWAVGSGTCVPPLFVRENKRTCEFQMWNWQLSYWVSYFKLFLYNKGENYWDCSSNWWCSLRTNSIAVVNILYNKYTVYILANEINAILPNISGTEQNNKSDSWKRNSYRWEESITMLRYLWCSRSWL